MDMSFAQALTEAKQVIVQQSNRIKTDAEKIKQQQQTIVDQCSLITEHDVKIRNQAGEIARHAEQIEALEAKLAEATIAREQAEAIIDRQGQRLTQQAEQLRDFETLVAEQGEAIEKLTNERDAYRDEIPSKEDEEALAAMAALLTTKKTPGARESSKDTNKTLRIGGELRTEAA